MKENNLMGQGLGSLLNIKIDDKKKVNNSEVDIELIDAGDYQPRTIFEETSLNELKESIIENGIIQPLIVTRNGDRYKLIAGERRLRASKLAGLKTVPVVIKEASNQSISLMSLIENVQRKDLGCVEIAKAYKRIVTEFSLSHDELAKKIGTNKSNVSNHLRLLNMPDSILDVIDSKDVSFGHSKILASIKNESTLQELVDLILNDNISVRRLTELVDSINDEKHTKSDEISSKPIANSESDLKSQKELSDTLPDDKVLKDKIYLTGFLVTIEQKKTKDDSGKLILDYNSKEELDLILSKLK